MRGWQERTTKTNELKEITTHKVRERNWSVYLCVQFSLTPKPAIMHQCRQLSELYFGQLCDMNIEMWNDADRTKTHTLSWTIKLQPKSMLFRRMNAHSRKRDGLRWTQSVVFGIFKMRRNFASTNYRPHGVSPRWNAQIHFSAFIIDFHLVACTRYRSIGSSICDFVFCRNIFLLS